MMKILLLTTLFCLASSVEIDGQGSPQLRGIVASAISEDVPAEVTVRIAKKP